MAGQRWAMRANYKMQRLFVTSPLAAKSPVALDKAQTNYLINVLRLGDGAELLVFNGHDGEWRAVVEKTGKKAAQLVCERCERAQPEAADFVFCFAPLKTGRLDYMVQKAVEMGASHLQPVITDHTQNRRLTVDKMRAWAIEAAEQCGVLNIPDCREPRSLEMVLTQWDPQRPLVFCDEDHRTHNPVSLIQAIPKGPLALLIGPEGGFSDPERARLRAMPFVHPIPLGPRILRADTAAVAAMAVMQATLGDWT